MTIAASGRLLVRRYEDFGFSSKKDMAAAIGAGTFSPRGRDLSGLDLSNCRLVRHAHSRDTDPDDGSQSGPPVDFSGCDLTGVRFDGAEIASGLFHGAVLDGASFHDVRLERCDFRWSHGENVDFSGIDDEESLFDGAALPGSDWTGAYLFRSQLHGTDLSGASFSGIEMNECDFGVAQAGPGGLIDGDEEALLDQAMEPIFVLQERFAAQAVPSLG